MADNAITAIIDIDDKEAQKELKKLHDKIEGLKFDTNVKEATKKRLESELASIVEAQKNINPNDDAAQKAIEARYDSTKKKIDAVTEAIKVNKETQSVAEQEFNRIWDENRISGFERAVGRIRDGLGNLVSGAAKLGMKLTAAFGSTVINGIKKLGAGIAKTVANMNVFQKVAEKISPVLHRIGKLATRVFFFSVITSGLRALRKTMSDWMGQNEAFSSALNQTKAALSTAFYPIYSAVLPALTSLLNALTSVLAAIARFNASLFGTTAKQAQNNAKALNQQAAATKKAGGAADKASKSFANFDEINQLGEKGGGAGGGAEADAGFDFEAATEPIEDFGQVFSDMLDGILEKLDRLPAIFDGLAKKINKFAKTALDTLTFKGVEEKVTRIGTKLAEALNGLVEKIDWNTIGQAIGAGLNLALSLAVGFLYTFDWVNFGRKLGELINGIVSRVNWYNFGKLLWAGFKIAIETVAGFLEKLDMKQLAKSASNVAKGFFNSITETLQKIEWKKIGEQVATFLKEIDWAGVATACFEAIGAAFGAAASFLWGLIQDAWNQVVQWWHDNAIKDGEFTMEGLLEGIKSVFVGIYTWLKTNVFDPFIDGFRKLFQINSPSKVMAEQGKYIADGVLVGIKSVFTGIYEWLKTNVFDPIWNGIRNLFGIDGNGTESSKMREVGKALSTGIASGITSAIQKVKDALNSVISLVERAVNWMIDKVNSISIDIPDPLGGSGLHIGFNLPRVNIPRLAEGAVIPPNREFMAVLGDQKSGTNIEAPLETIVQAMQMALGNTGGGKKEIVLMLDRRELGRATVDVLNLESQRVGMKLGGVYG